MPLGCLPEQQFVSVALYCLSACVVLKSWTQAQAHSQPLTIVAALLCQRMAHLWAIVDSQDDFCNTSSLQGLQDTPICQHARCKSPGATPRRATALTSIWCTLRMGQNKKTQRQWYG